MLFAYFFLNTSKKHCFIIMFSNVIMLFGATLVKIAAGSSSTFIFLVTLRANPNSLSVKPIPGRLQVKRRMMH